MTETPRGSSAPTPHAVQPSAPAAAAEPSGTSAVAAGTGVAIAGVVSGVCGLVVQLLAANTLEPAQNARFLVFWSLLFGVFGVLGGVQQEATRSVRAATASGPLGAGAPRGPRVVPAGAAIGLGVAAVLAGLVALLAAAGIDLAGSSDGPGASALLVAVVGGGSVLFAVHAAVAGALAGTNRWGDYSLLVGGEATVRLVLTGLAALVGAGVQGYELAAAAAAATWLLLTPVRPGLRAAWRARADRPVGAHLRATAQAMGATTAMAVLVTGYAVLVDLTTPPEVVAASAPLLLAVSLTRATLLMPVNAFQGMAISYVAGDPRRARPLLVRAGAIVAAVAAVGAVAAYLLGPWLFDVLRPGYRVSAPVFAGLMVGAGALALIVLVSTVCLSLGHHGAYVGGWVVAVVVAVAALLVPGSIEARVVLSLVAGPLVGALVHAAALIRGAGRVTPSGRPA